MSLEDRRHPFLRCTGRPGPAAPAAPRSFSIGERVSAPVSERASELAICIGTVLHIRRFYLIGHPVESNYLRAFREARLKNEAESDNSLQEICPFRPRIMGT